MNVFVGYPRDRAGYSFHHRTKAKVFVAQSGIFFEKEFLAKGLSGRTIELDMIVESEQDEQSSAAPEMVPGAATSLIALVPTKCCSPGDRSTY
jgi:hypothetical protein